MIPRFYHFVPVGQPLWTQRFRIAQHETHESVSAPKPVAFAERFSDLPENQSEQVLILLDRISQIEPGGQLQANHYADMQQVLTLMGSMTPRPRTDPTAVLNSLSLLTHQLGMPFSTPLEIFRQLFRQLPVAPKRLAEIRQKQEEKARRLNLKKSLPHRAEAPLLNKTETLPPEKIKKVLSLLISTVDTGENFDGLKNGGYKQPEQTRAIQEALIVLGYYQGTPDGDYGPQTRLAVKKLQMDLNVSADGAFGNGTFLALRNFLEAKLQNAPQMSPAPSRKQRQPTSPAAASEAPKESSTERYQGKQYLPPVPSEDANIGSGETSSPQSQLSAELQQMQEYARSFPAYIEMIGRIHGAMVKADALSLQVDPRNIPEGTQYEARSTAGAPVGRTFFKQNGEVYYSESVDIRETFIEKNLLFHKLGDSSGLYIFAKETGGMTPVTVTNTKNIYFADIRGEKLLLDRAGNAGRLSGQDFVFEKGQFAGIRYFVGNITPKKAMIYQGEYYPDGEPPLK